MDKVNQNATLLFYMDIMPVRWPRHKVDNPVKQKTKDLMVKNFLLNENEKNTCLQSVIYEPFFSSIGY